MHELRRSSSNFCRNCCPKYVCGKSHLFSALSLCSQITREPRVQLLNWLRTCQISPGWTIASSSFFVHRRLNPPCISQGCGHSGFHRQKLRTGVAQKEVRCHLQAFCISDLIQQFSLNFSERSDLDSGGKGFTQMWMAGMCNPASL